MSQEEMEEKPLTFSKFLEFYREVMQPDFEKMMMTFHQEVIRPDFGKMMVTFHQEVIRPDFYQTLVKFHVDFVEPRMDQRIDEKIEDKLQPFRMEMLDHFDDLHKQIETLRQEYVFANEHIRRLDDAVFGGTSKR